MALTFQLLLLLVPITPAFTKYAFIQNRKNWADAHSNCESTYTDLAPINDERDINLLRALIGNYRGYIWFGLLRNMTDKDKWFWSGGGEVTWFNWGAKQPSQDGDQKYGILENFMWHDIEYDDILAYSMCYRVYVVREEMTWEEALDHCRKKYTDLATISSETELMLIQKELRKYATTAHVWMGLRYMSGEWFWLDGQVRAYEVWGQSGKPDCPAENLACGALVVNSGGLKQWNAHVCVEKLHFICY